MYCAMAVRSAFVSSGRALALRHGLPPPQEDAGPLPAWLAPHYGDARPRLEAFLAKPDAATIPAVVETLERTLTVGS